MLVGCIFTSAVKDELKIQGVNLFFTFSSSVLRHLCVPSRHDYLIAQLGQHNSPLYHACSAFWILMRIFLSTQKKEKRKKKNLNPSSVRSNKTSMNGVINCPIDHKGRQCLCELPTAIESGTVTTPGSTKRWRATYFRAARSKRVISKSTGLFEVVDVWRGPERQPFNHKQQLRVFCWGGVVADSGANGLARHRCTLYARVTSGRVAVIRHWDRPRP